MKAYGPGLKPTGVIVNKPTEFTIDARMAGKGHLKIYAQVLQEHQFVKTSLIIYRNGSFIMHMAFWSSADMLLYLLRMLKATLSTSRFLTKEMAHFCVCTLQSSPLNTPSSSPGEKSACPTAPSG